MKPTPAILRHKGILTNWRGYPEGSVERAKALGIEVIQTAYGLEATLGLWQSTVNLLQKEQPWKALGLKSVDDFVEQVVGKSTKEISGEIKKRVQIQKLKDENPDWTQQMIADEVGVDRSYVSRVVTKKSNLDNLVTTPDFSSRTNKADFRKLPDELQSQVRNKEISLNAAAIKAGIRRKKSPEEIVVANFRKCENRLEPLKFIVESLEDYEKSVLCDWLEHGMD